MSLDIGDAISNALERTTERNGLVLVGVFALFQLVNTVVGQSFATAYFTFIQGRFESMPGGGPGMSPGMDSGVFPFGPVGAAEMPLSLPIPLPVAALLMLALAVVVEGLRVVAIRVVASDERGSFPDAATDGLGLATLNAFVASIIVGVLVGIGFVFLLVPGLFLAVSFYFVRPAIALEDVNAVEALSRAWEVASGERIELFLLLVVVWLLSLLASVPSAILGVVSPLAGALVGVVVGAVVLVFSIGVATDAFLQLREESDEIGAVSADSEFFENTGER
jgi:hypothetical protein